MRTLLVLSVLVCAVSAFSLLREFDDERLLPHFRVRRAAEESAEVVAVASGAELKDEEKIAVEASGEEEKVRRRRSDEILIGSGEGSGEDAPAAKPSARRRRTADAAGAEVVQGSGEEGSGQE
ncbi:hypothetical protein M3Y99_01407200 [Aphelenchoides fujianensis]|nr:hypothetical protein M3Y99_01407200 [Aphelenchoides fujianensis]